MTLTVLTTIYAWKRIVRLISRIKLTGFGCNNDIAKSSFIEANEENKRWYPFFVYVGA